MSRRKNNNRSTTRIEKFKIKLFWTNEIIHKLESFGKDFYYKEKDGVWISSRMPQIEWNGKIIKNGIIVQDINEYDWCIRENPFKFKGTFSSDGRAHLICLYKMYWKKEGY